MVRRDRPASVAASHYNANQNAVLMGELFGILLLSAHLLAMNLASAGPLVAAWLMGRRGESGSLALARRLLRWSLAALVVGGALGGAMLLTPSDGLRAALARFPASTYWFAGAELAFSGACLVAMLVAERWLSGRPVMAWLVALVCASNLLYHFPPLMAVIGQLSADRQWTSDELILRPALLRLATRPEILAMWLHFALASIAASAVVGMWPVSQADRIDDSTPSDRLVRQLAAIALVTSLLQVPVGVWVLVSSRADARDAVLGSDFASSASFLGGVVAALALLQGLASVAMGDTAPATRRRTVGLLMAVALLMSATLTISRRATRHERIDAQGNQRSAASGGDASAERVDA
jgi:hypothetical protein